MDSGLQDVYGCKLLYEASKSGQMLYTNAVVSMSMITINTHPDLEWPHPDQHSTLSYSKIMIAGVLLMKEIMKNSTGAGE